MNNTITDTKQIYPHSPHPATKSHTHNIPLPLTLQQRHSPVNRNNTIQNPNINNETGNGILMSVEQSRATGVFGSPTRSIDDEFGFLQHKILKSYTTKIEKNKIIIGLNPTPTYQDDGSVNVDERQPSVQDSSESVKPTSKPDLSKEGEETVSLNSNENSDFIPTFRNCKILNPALIEADSEPLQEIELQHQNNKIKGSEELYQTNKFNRIIKNNTKKLVNQNQGYKRLQKNENAGEAGRGLKKSRRNLKGLCKGDIEILSKFLLM